MEKNTNDLVGLSNIPPEIQQHIAAYLDAPRLSFFAQSNKQVLKNILPVLLKYQAMSPLRLAANGNSAYFYQADQLFVCGSNKCGELGIGDQTNRSIFTAVLWPEGQDKIQQVIQGGSYAFVLTNDRRLWVCGQGYSKLLEPKGYKDCSIFSAVPWLTDQGKVEQIAAGITYIIVLTNDKRLWRYNLTTRHEQLALKDNDGFTFSTSIPWPKERGKIKQLIAGRDHSFVVTDDNQLWGFGYNYSGQLGVGDNECRDTFTPVPWPANRGKIEQVVTGGDHTVVLTDMNCLYVCGDNYFGQIGLGDNKECFNFTQVPWPENRGKIKHIIAALFYTIVLTQDNKLWVCGHNKYGQLGFGDEKDYDIFTALPWPEERGRINQVIVGWNHTFVLTEDNRLWACGNNDAGQLGLGDNINRSNFVLVKQLPIAMKQLIASNNCFNQLIKVGISLTQTSGIGTTFHMQHQRDEPEGQPPLKKMRL